MRTARSAALLVALAGPIAGSCVGDTPPNAVAAPDISRLTVFFPLDGLVNGRGSPGPTPAEYEWVFIRPHPSRNVFTFAKVNKTDGSFSFRIAATGNDILEVAYAATNKESAPRGAPAFIEVPLQPAAGQSFFCCKNPTGISRCQPTTEAVCSNAITLPECSDNADCAYLSGERIGVTAEDFTVSQPDATGLVTLTGENPAYALHLLRVENRGQRAVGGRDPRIRDYLIIDENGRASISMRARGDDEIVLRIFDIDGYTRSREHALYVPDADFAGIDIVGVFPFEGLQGGQPGRIGVRLAPYGIDQRGICAPSNEPGPALCFSAGHAVTSNGQSVNFNGGLDYNYVRISAVVSSTAARITEPDPAVQMAQNTKFTDGNVLAPPQAVALVIDDSCHADDDDVDVQARRFRAAENFLSSARTRDQVMIFVTGSHPGIASGNGYDQRTRLVSPEEATNNLLELETLMSGGSNGIYAAVAAAADALFDQARDREGRILVIGANDPADDVQGFSNAVLAITGDDRTGRPIYPVYVVTRPLQDPLISNDYRTLPGFTQGRFNVVGASDEFLTSTAEVTGGIFGAYVLMYVLDVPRRATGKVAGINITVTVSLPDPKQPTMLQERTATYDGTIELRDNVAN